MTASTHALDSLNSNRAGALRRWVALPVVLTGVAMVVLDFFIVNVAMPGMQADLHAGASAIQWVVAGYGLAFAALLITGGRLGDHLGRRRMFSWGLALFTITSAAAGVAPSADTLVIARVAQGAASALLMPQVLAIIGVAYDGEDRTRAITAYAMTLGVASVGGQLIGGVLIQANLFGLDWRSCFLVNVPIGIAALVLTPRVVPESRSEGSTELDLVGAAVVTAALVAVVLPLIQGRAAGWPAWTWASFAAAPVLLADFVLTQRKRARRGNSALVHPSLFAERAFSVGLVSVTVFYASVASFFLVLAFYLQEARGLGALESGLVFSMLGAGFMVTSMVAGSVAARLGRHTLALGAAMRAVALLGLWLAVSKVGSHGSIAWLAPPLVLDGAGMGLVMGPMVSTVLAGVSPEHAGAASGVLATAQQVGNALGIAVIGVVFFGATDAGHTIAHAFRLGLIDLAGLSLVVAALVQLLPRRREAEAVAST
jgi:EmrB/QacA subfamily drug resistance transporter